MRKGSDQDLDSVTDTHTLTQNTGTHPHTPHNTQRHAPPVRVKEDGARVDVRESVRWSVDGRRDNSSSVSRDAAVDSTARVLPPCIVLLLLLLPPCFVLLLLLLLPCEVS